MAVGFAAALLSLVADIIFVTPLTTPGMTIIYMLIPWAMVYWGIKPAIVALTRIELLRVVFPPLVLIVAVLGSILGGITNPTPAAGLGASGALMLAAFRKLNDEQKSTKLILQASYAVVICILMGVNFDLRMNVEGVDAERWIAFLFAYGAYLYALFGLLYACFILHSSSVLAPVVRETSKVTSMVFTILIGSQVLNLVVISFGGEHYIQQYLRSFDNEVTIFLIVMVLLFLLGFVLDFLEIIYIVVPIVGPVIYGGTFDPAWVTIMIAINLQTSFLTPPFGFALFYLKGRGTKIRADDRHLSRRDPVCDHPDRRADLSSGSSRRSSPSFRSCWTDSADPAPARLCPKKNGRPRGGRSCFHKLPDGQAGAFCPRIFSSAVSRLVTVRSISISLSRPNSPMRKLA